jgi:hypothetical protein
MQFALLGASLAKSSAIDWASFLVCWWPDVDALQKDSVCAELTRGCVRSCETALVRTIVIPNVTLALPCAYFMGQWLQVN